MFALHNLGWSAFQQLCLTITREILGQTVESFLDSGDGGRDGAFAGTWKPRGRERARGQFVIQCKFTSKLNYSLQPADLADEVAKAKVLVGRGLCDAYVLMTNAGVSGVADSKIKAIFKAVGVKHVFSFGATWVTQQIRESKRLRMLVPRVYGLGDLSQILDERAYLQARSVLESMREDLAKVVMTDAYNRAAEAIDKHSFVFLIGEPAAGKTTIASLLAMAALDQWNASTLKLDDPGKVTEHWNPDEPSQFFWVDDAFGVTQYEDFLVRRWNHVLPTVPAMIRKGAKFVMTSRDYIYNRARKDLKVGAFPLLSESQVVIDVRDLSANEKRQILYNHLKLGRQSRTFISKLKPFLSDAADHPRFIPETARRLGDPLFTKSLHLTSYHVRAFVERREQLMQEVIEGLDPHSKAALALIYMRAGRLQSPVKLQPSEGDAIERLGSTLGGCVAALESMKGSLVLLSLASGDHIWEFKHPTIGDAYAATLIQNPEHLGIYLEGTATERLLTQVTCGDVGIEKAVVLANSFFPKIVEKLQSLSSSRAYKDAWLATWGAQRDLQGFLARRCSKDFLSLYLSHNPAILDQVASPGLFLSVVSEVGLAKRLHEVGLLPETQRQKFIATVSNYAIEGEDASALDDEDIRSIFTDAEHEDLTQRVRAELLPRLGDVRREAESNHSSGTSPEAHMRPVFDVFDVLKKHFGEEDDDVLASIEQEERRAREWVEKMSLRNPTERHASWARSTPR